MSRYAACLVSGVWEARQSVCYSGLNETGIYTLYMKVISYSLKQHALTY